MEESFSKWHIGPRWAHNIKQKKNWNYIMNYQVWEQAHIELVQNTPTQVPTSGKEKEKQCSCYLSHTRRWSNGWYRRLYCDPGGERKEVSPVPLSLQQMHIPGGPAPPMCELTQPRVRDRCRLPPLLQWHCNIRPFPVLPLECMWRRSFWACINGVRPPGDHLGVSASHYFH